MNPFSQNASRCPGRLSAPLTRRVMLQHSATGFGMLALAALGQQRAFGTAAPSHFPARAKNVIFLFMDGGVSHVDTFDPKPALAQHAGQRWKDGANAKWLPSPWTFSQHGQCGTPVSELFPQIASCVDDMAVIRSMKGDLPLHSSGVTLLHTGHNLAGRPSLGSWMSYGLGSENDNLPSYVVLSFGHVPVGGLEVMGSGFLPARHEATFIRADGAPIDNIVPSDPLARQRTKLAYLQEEDAAFDARLGGNDAVESAVRNYELAARMQSLVPDVLDESRESASIRQLYGLDDADTNTRLYARQCLRARRLVESGVRFVQVNCPYGQSNGTWDQHGNLKNGHERNARQTDRAVAALIKDLKQRGLLDSTLVVWAGEFGRTPFSPGLDGRDHHTEGFSVFLAGGGIKGGVVHGATDEHGVHAVDNICEIHDLHATILYLAGIDHERLTFRHAGRDFRLTDVKGSVIRAVLA